MNYANKHCLITGASSGIGKALAEELISQNAHVYVCARRLDLLQKLKTDYPKADLKIFKADVTKPEELQEMAKSIPQLDVVIANAGFGVMGNFEVLSVEDYRRQFEANVFGLMETLKIFLPLIKESRGSFVLLGSVMSYLSLPGTSAYSMSKYAVRALGETLYHELLKENVSVTTVCPGFVRSEIRRVDNEGVYQKEAKDPVPEWLQISAQACARKILKASAKRRRELVVGHHARLSIFLKSYFPSFFHWAISKLPVGPARSWQKR